jgi:glycosyltransferase involved in cell wall biosynthesis
MRPGRPELRALVRLVRLLGEDKPDVVQTWMYHSDLLGGIAAVLVGVPVVWGVRHGPLERRDKILTRATRKACAIMSRRVPHAIVCNSESARRAHSEAGYAAEKLVVVPNGFDVSRFRPSAEARAAVRRELGIPLDAPVVGLVARFHPHKDHGTFLSAAAMVRDECDVARFVLCGDGVEWSNHELASEIERRRLGPAVHLLGRRDDVERITASLDVACLSSITESFPNVVGEAMACGVPCVSTDCGDVQEIVEGSGRVVPVRDPAALANAVLEILRLDERAREERRRAARSRIIAHYSIEVVALRFDEIQRGAMRACAVRSG